MRRATNDEQVNSARPNRLPLWRKVILGGSAVVAAGSVAWGAHQMTREDNWQDFQDLKEFTSADGQEDRCNTQDAVDAQEKMRVFFEEHGGITPEQAAALGAAVGLEPEETYDLLTTELPDISYDCVDDNGVASTQEATIGLGAAALGGGALLGGAGAAALVYRRRQGAPEAQTAQSSL